MAQMANKYFSPQKCYDVSQRHVHLSNRSLGTDNPYSMDILPLNNVLHDKIAVHDDASKAKVFATDEVHALEQDLDNAIRTSHDRCRQYAREKDEKVDIMEFYPNGSFRGIISQGVTKKVEDVEELVLQFEGLGEEHPLYEHAAILRSIVDDIKVAVSSYQEAKHTVTEAKVAMLTAKMNVIKQYKKNYFAANAKLGRQRADRLFPVIYTRKKDDTLSEEEASE